MSGASLTADQPQGESQPQPQVQPKEAPSAPKSPNQRKWGKPLLVAVICLLVVVIVVGACLIWNMSAKRAIATEAVELLKTSDTVAELTIPSNWGDQSGFSVGGVDVNAVECGPFGGDSAQVAITADIDNGRYAGQATYDVALAKSNGAWELASIEQDSLRYYPVAGIADSVIVEKLPQLVADLPEYLPQDYADLPSPSIIYGEGATGEVVGNLFDNFDDSIMVSLSAEKDGIAYADNMTLFFKWVEGTDEPADWKLSYVNLDTDAFLAAGSIVHEGLAYMSTEEEEAEAANTALGSDEWIGRISPELEFEDGSQYAWAFIENIPNNNVDWIVTIELDDGQVVYTSPRIPAGCTLEAIRLNEKLPAGTYDAVASFRAYEPGTNVYAGNLDFDIKLIVG